MWLVFLSCFAFCDSLRIAYTYTRFNPTSTLYLADDSVDNVPRIPSERVKSIFAPNLANVCLAFLPLLSRRASRAADSYGFTVPDPRKAVLPLVYSIETSFSPPYLQPRTKQGEDGVLRRICKKGNVVLVGMNGEDPGCPDVELGFDLADRMLRVLDADQNSLNAIFGSILGSLTGSQRGAGNMSPPTRVVSGPDREDVVLALGWLQRTESTRLALEAYFQRQGANEAAAYDEDVEVVRAVLGQGHTIPASTGDRVTSSQCSCGGKCGALLRTLSWAKHNRVRVEPVGIPSKVQQAVTAKGLGALSDAERATLISDVPGFIGSRDQPGFARYANTVLLAGGPPEGGEDSAHSAEDRVAARMLCQEIVASTAAHLAAGDDTRTNSSSSSSSSSDGGNSGRLVVLWLDCKDVVFALGVQERVKRNLQALSQQRSQTLFNNADVAATVQKKAATSSAYSVLLNPTARDSMSDTAQLRLSLPYSNSIAASPLTAEGSRAGQLHLPLADFLWYSGAGPPARLLPRVKNAIGREGDKPPGESSILRAF